MPSKNTNIIGNLRGRHDPHYKLAARVDNIERDLLSLSGIHATLSKSFGLQRKTLARVIGLEQEVKSIPRGVTTIKGERGEAGKAGRRGRRGSGGRRLSLIHI